MASNAHTVLLKLIKWQWLAILKTIFFPEIAECCCWESGFGKACKMSAERLLEIYDKALGHSSNTVSMNQCADQDKSSFFGQAHYYAYLL